ncbi:hypothetical protein LINPERHAP2_LOCUS32574, partial [Linum perenne]
YFNSLKQSRRSHRCSSQFSILNPQYSINIQIASFIRSNITSIHIVQHQKHDAYSSITRSIISQLRLAQT